MGIDLLVLSADAEFEDVWKVFGYLRRFKRLEARAKMERERIPVKEGKILLVNDEVLERHEFELAIRGIRFFTNWKANDDYRNSIKYTLKNGNVYVMCPTNNKRDWNFRQSFGNDIEIHDLKDKVNITLKYDQTLIV